jgi:hypothetical protein
MGGLREKAYHHQRTEAPSFGGAFLSPHGPGPAHAPSAEPTPLAGRYLGVLLGLEMLLVVAVAAFTVLVAVIEWPSRERKGRKSHAELHPELVAPVRQLRRRRPKGGQSPWGKSQRS